MDFISALIGPQFPDQDDSAALRHTMHRLYPRIPALFEPLAPRVDLASFEETSSTVFNESARRASDTSPASPPARQEISREREPYRGVMNPPPALDVENPPELGSTQNNVPRVIKSLVERAPETPTERVAHETHPETPAVTRSIRPTLFLEPRLGETNTETKQDAEPPTAPIVRVNIGRIVVRAVSETRPAPPKREVKSKKLSLDDYLKKRERGEG